jgi:hypothetical protein
MISNNKHLLSPRSTLPQNCPRKWNVSSSAPYSLTPVSLPYKKGIILLMDMGSSTNTKIVRLPYVPVLRYSVMYVGGS